LAVDLIEKEDEEYKMHCNVKIELRYPQEPAQETGMEEYENARLEA